MWRHCSVTCISVYCFCSNLLNQTVYCQHALSHQIKSLEHDKIIVPIQFLIRKSEVIDRWLILALTSKLILLNLHNKVFYCKSAQNFRLLKKTTYCYHFEVLHFVFEASMFTDDNSILCLQSGLNKYLSKYQNLSGLSEYR